jgi:hypothetical protein
VIVDTYMSFRTCHDVIISREQTWLVAGDNFDAKTAVQPSFVAYFVAWYVQLTGYQRLGASRTTSSSHVGAVTFKSRQVFADETEALTTQLVSTEFAKLPATSPFLRTFWLDVRVGSRGAEHPEGASSCVRNSSVKLIHHVLPAIP